MDWTKVEKTPEWNPAAFELARHVRGWTMRQLSKASGIPVKRISQIEKGIDSPSLAEVIKLSESEVLNFPLGFFSHWHETEIKINAVGLAVSVPIDYFKYPVFRKLNPPRLYIA
jgi:transcriptional regulator with XRE-family HTH domain